MPIEPKEILLRIALAFFAGFILGLERESHGRAAGLRTMVLVCVAAASAAILSEVLYVGSFKGPFQSDNWHPDPARLGAGILTGIGFLGAGVILRHGNLVRGVTTASQIWLVTILGLCLGSGEFFLGLTGLGVSICTVFFLRYVEDLVRRDWYATCTVATDTNGATTKEISTVFSELNMTVKHLEIDHDVASKKRTLVFHLRFKRDPEENLPEKTIGRILLLSGVQRVDWK